MRAVALLTLDKGSVLYNPDQMPKEVVLKHTDGELIKIERTATGEWKTKRRHELEANFWGDGVYRSLVTAVATLVDRQAFGFRLDGEAVNPLAPDIGSTQPGTIEIEALDIGGVLFEGSKQLPFAVYTEDETYYRVFVTEVKDVNSNLPEELAVVEKRKGPRGEWEELGRAEPTEAGHLATYIAEETGMATVSGTATELQEAINEHQELFKASYTEEDEAIRERMAIQNNTAFDPSTPRPRPVTFPD